MVFELLCSASIFLIICQFFICPLMVRSTFPFSFGNIFFSVRVATQRFDSLYLCGLKLFLQALRSSYSVMRVSYIAVAFVMGFFLFLFLFLFVVILICNSFVFFCRSFSFLFLYSFSCSKAIFSLIFSA